ncbi:MAG: TAT-variant-translocated molybdopterin oxidoreductase [Elusimicrobia bacterium]|nr:TAT-variant-translocated molybdopterin oxidoreductase [Elusimicrobiota bacterium]
MKNKRYWRGLSERENPQPDTAQPEFAEPPAVDEGFDISLSRRSFLKAAGFSLGGVLLSSCGRGPVGEVISSLAQPEELVPGRAVWYSSTCAGCAAGCGALVKNRDSRPLKLEGIPEHPLSRGGLCAVGQASVLGLYDDHRLRAPLSAGKPCSWEALDAEIIRELDAISRKGGSVRVLARTITSPTLKAALESFLRRFRDGRLVVYDPLSCSALLDAHQSAFGLRALPRLHFERAGVIAGFDADFLGTWISPVEYAAGYRAGRTLEGKPARQSRHIHFEPRMSLTGANADERIVLGAREVAAALAHLALDLARRAGLPAASGALPACPIDAGRLRGFADELWAARGHSLVVTGANELSAQLYAALANSALGNYSHTLDLDRPSFQRQGDDGALQSLLAELSAGRVDALFTLDANPAAELPRPGAWRKALEGTPLVVSFAGRVDETSALARFTAPDHHPLEAWADYEPVAGLVSTAQPVIRPLGDTRPALESLSAWTGNRRPALDLIRDHWRGNIYPRRKGAGSFEDFWTSTVHDGFAEISVPAGRAGAFRPSAIRPAAPPSAAAQPHQESPAAASGLQLALYAKTGLLDGRFSDNPWLQELPDPVTKIVWDNYASFSPDAASRLGLAQGDVVRLSAPSGAHLELPAHIQPGQHDGTVAVALGYGRLGTERFADAGPRWLQGRPTVAPGMRVGKNAAELLAFDGGPISFDIGGVSVSKTGARHELSCTQEYHSLQLPERLASEPGETRDIVRETGIEEYRRDPSAGNKQEHGHESLWPEHVYEGHRWGMAVDLSACTGCSACVVACQSENNVPVVGKDEVGRRRDMAWLRIDRYYADRDGGTDVVFQPMLCQHCANAPCETVCPVLATMHSAEGLNQQIYNRCVGTRYCANNCPYKARRFNWFQYQKEGRLSNLALNPDVTVRMRGVMEKCTFCVQRIQEAKFEAKRLGRPLQDGEIRPACAQSCPSQAIVFGDVNDPGSRISRLRKDPRHYRVLAELNVQPSVGYLVKVRSRAGNGGGSEHG